MKLSELLNLHQSDNILSPQTVLKYKSIIRIFKKDTSIDNIDISYEQAIAWRNQIYNRVSVISCNSYHRHMKALMSTAVKYNHLDANCFKEFKMIKVAKPNYKLINDDTLNKLIYMINNDKYYSQLGWFYLALIDILRFTGIRRRQLIGLKWRDLNFHDETLFLSADFSKNKNTNLIPINQKLLDHFLKIKQKSVYTQDDDQIFNITQFITSYAKNNMTEDHVTGLFVKWSRKINIQISPHRFRHTVATKLANSVTNLKTVSQILGHSNIKTTLGYIYVDMNDMRSAINLL